MSSNEQFKRLVMRNIPWKDQTIEANSVDQNICHKCREPMLMTPLLHGGGGKVIVLSLVYHKNICTLPRQNFNKQSMHACNPLLFA